MRFSRREFLKVAAAAAAAGRLSPAALADLGRVLRIEGGPRVIWLQGAGCDGDAISFLNSIHYATVDSLLTTTIDLEFQNNLMAVTGDMAVSVGEAAGAEPGYILVVEGGIPVGGAGKYCTVWHGLSMYDAVVEFSQNAGFILALGTCASFGGVTGGAPNPTNSQGVGGVIGPDDRLINLPGCPAHPDWLVGTIVYLLTNGYVPPLDEHRRPLEFFGRRIHDNCFNRREYCGQGINFAPQLSSEGCKELLGCKGKRTYADCPMRKWNSDGSGEFGVNWCIGSGTTCLGCVEPGFPDALSPFYVYLPTPDGAESSDTGDRGTTADSPEKKVTNRPDNHREMGGISGHDDHN